MIEDGTNVSNFCFAEGGLKNLAHHECCAICAKTNAIIHHIGCDPHMTVLQGLQVNRLGVSSLLFMAGFTLHVGTGNADNQADLQLRIIHHEGGSENVLETKKQHCMGEVLSMRIGEVASMVVSGMPRI